MWGEGQVSLFILKGTSFLPERIKESNKKITCLGQSIRNPLAKPYEKFRVRIIGILTRALKSLHLNNQCIQK